MDENEMIRQIGPNYNLIVMQVALVSDTRRAHTELCANRPGKQDYLRRQYVRSVFAMIEGITYTLKRLSRDSGVAFTDAEQAMMRDETYTLNQQGEAIAVPPRLQLQDELKFAFRIYAKSVGLTFSLSTQERGWQAFQRARKIRDRLMHPKSIDDLFVADPELEDVEEASRWFRESQNSLLQQMVHQTLRNNGLTEEQIRDFDERAEARLKQLEQEEPEKPSDRDLGLEP